MSEKRLDSLDLLRGIAAYTVAIPHLLLFAVPGNAVLESLAVLGVEIFFVLSGYVLTPQLIHCYNKPRQFHIFIFRRWARTIPPYFLALISMTLIAGALGSYDFIYYAFYVQNLFSQINVYDYFSIAWSLSIEEWFYVAFPVVLLCCRSFLPRGDSGVLFSAIVVILVFSIIRIIFGDLDGWGANVRRVVVFRVDAIAYGVVLYIISPIFISRFNLSKFLCVLVAATGCALAAFCLFKIANNNSGLAKIIFPYAVSVFGSALILLALQFELNISRSVVARFVAAWSGRISYSTYLFHPIFAILIFDRLGDIFFPLKVAICMLSLLLFSIILFYFFERPILRTRPRYKVFI